MAPRGELVGERIVRQIVGDVVAEERLGAAAVTRGRLRPLIDGYLVPLGLARLRNDGVTVSPDPARSPAVAETLRLVGDSHPVPAVDVVAALAEGPVGLTDSEVGLVLNACVQAGLVEAWRARKRLEVPFLAVASTDRLGAGELLEPATRAAVADLVPIVGAGPFDPPHRRRGGTARAPGRRRRAPGRHRTPPHRTGRPFPGQRPLPVPPRARRRTDQPGRAGLRRRGVSSARKPVEQFRAGAARLLQRVDDVFREAAADDLAGCLRIWEVGTAIVAPLLTAHRRVAVLLIDASEPT